MDYDVVIVGAGSNGLTAGYFIAKQGFKTLILERGRVAGEKCQGPTEFPALGQFKSDPKLYDLMASVLKEVPYIKNESITFSEIYNNNKIILERIKDNYNSPANIKNRSNSSEFKKSATLIKKINSFLQKILSRKQNNKIRK